MQPVYDLGSQAVLQAACLVQSALPDYFETMGPEQANAVVTAEFGSADCELARCMAALDGYDVPGILCTYPMNELAERQYRSVQLVARTLTMEEYRSFAGNLRSLRSGLPDIVGKGTYLAFIAVAVRARGTGLANALMVEAIERAGSEPLLLTVRNDNRRARAFYDRHRFIVAAEGTQFSLLKRD